MRQRRLPGWRAALAAEIEQHRREPFAWGKRDCALFACNCARAMTGVDHAAPFRGHYRTALGALRALRKAGHKDIVALAAATLEEVHPSRAGVGDVAVVETDQGAALGVVTGPQIAVFAPNGIGTLPLSAALRAFRV